MLRLAIRPRLHLLPLFLLAAVASGAAAHQPAPPVGYDAAYDYGIANDPASDADPYYRYPGPPPTDPRAREQMGLRDGVLPIKPRTPYYAGVRLYGDYGYGYGYGHGYGACGCARYHRRYTVYYDDFGIPGASYRSYDHSPRQDYGRGYGY